MCDVFARYKHPVGIELNDLMLEYVRVPAEVTDCDDFYAINDLGALRRIAIGRTDNPTRMSSARQIGEPYEITAGRPAPCRSV